MTFHRLAEDVVRGLGGKLATKEPQTVVTLKAKLKQIPGVKDVYTTDNVPSEGYFQLRVVLKTGDKFRLNTQARSSELVYPIQDYSKVFRAVRSIALRSGLESLEIEGIEKKYEYQSPLARHLQERPLSGYSGNEIRVSFVTWDGEETSRTADKTAVGNWNARDDKDIREALNKLRDAVERAGFTQQSLSHSRGKSPPEIELVFQGRPGRVSLTWQLSDELAQKLAV